MIQKKDFQICPTKNFVNLRIANILRGNIPDPDWSAPRSAPMVNSKIAERLLKSGCVLRLGVDRILLQDDWTIFMQQEPTKRNGLHQLFSFNCAKMQLKCRDLRSFALTSPKGFPHALDNIQMFQWRKSS